MMQPRVLAVCCLLGLALAGVAAPLPANDPGVVALARLQGRVPGFTTVALPKTGVLQLTPAQSLTIEALRGVPLDEHPPTLGPLPAPYPAHLTAAGDKVPPAFATPGLQPFRFKYFNNELNFSTPYLDVYEYGALHGYNILHASQPTAYRPAMPAGTVWLTWNGAIGWDQWFDLQGLPSHRYDLLPPVDELTQQVYETEVSGMTRDATYYMLDMEHAYLLPDQLRQQAWYPRTGTDAEKQAFEARYYDGVVNTDVAPIRAARRHGWKTVSLYGWSPFGRTWGGAAQADALDPATDWSWNTIGKRIAAELDIVHNSVYSFYYSPQNVAYTLTNIDANMRLLQTLPQPKPLRTYYMSGLHGGGGGWRWWMNQPIPDEEFRAQAILALFTGIDGVVLWNGHIRYMNLPDPLAKDQDRMLKDAFELRPDGAAADAPATAFKRYNVVHITALDATANTVTFQLIQPAKRNSGVGADEPSYTMPRDALLGHLRTTGETVRSFTEGLALAKPFEYLLRHGTRKIDVSAAEQFAKTLPIVRRVQHGPYHLIATYDPAVIYDKQPREITLDNFNGVAGLTLKLPADAQVRLFVLKEE